MGNQNEIWKDIEGYEGLYQVSNRGRVKSLDYRRNGAGLGATCGVIVVMLVINIINGICGFND